ncbi:MAG: ATP-binding protein [Ignavibacteriales bacterium]|nr:ATP-binding protein [Ignavibacteriales bacterium]
MQKSFTRSTKALDEIFDFIGTFFREHKVGKEVAFSIKFAVEELFTNFVKYNLTSKSEISLNLSIEGKNLVVRLMDSEAQPFDPTKAPDPDLHAPLEQRRAGGLGIFLVKRMIDKIEYHHTDKMSTITLVQSLEK